MPRNRKVLEAMFLTKSACHILKGVLSMLQIWLSIEYINRLISEPQAPSQVQAILTLNIIDILSNFLKRPFFVHLMNLERPDAWESINLGIMHSIFILTNNKYIAIALQLV